MIVSRRALVAYVGAGAVAAPALAAERLAPTPQETLGPFYPAKGPVEHDADLTRVRGRSARAAGQVVDVSGRVLRRDGAPVKGARLEMWQANAAGRYAHAADSNPAPLDPNFQGYALLRTDADGRFRLITVKPGPYPTGGGRVRTPHLHFLVEAGAVRLGTQMYFPGEPLNDQDELIASAASRNMNPHLLIARDASAGVAGANRYAWDIVLR